MPILPPRNLPFSPAGASPHTPPSKKNEDRLESSPSTTPSRKRGSDGSGILPRQEETTFHRKLKSILWDHCNACEKWEDVVSLQGAKHIASIARLSSTLDDLLTRQFKKEDVNDIAGLYLHKGEEESRRLDEMSTILKGLELERVELQDVMNKVTKVTSKLEGLSDAAEGILIEATRVKGSGFSFEKEMWVTWSMDRFVGVIQLVTSRHVLQTQHLYTLTTLLLDQGCAPGKTVSMSRTRDEEEGESESEEESGDEADDDLGKEKRKRRARIRERVMEEWQALTLLKDEERGIDSEWFEDVCQVEVGRWEER